MATSTLRLKATALVTSPLISKVFENAKTLLFFYVVLTHSLKAHRHLRARGVTSSAREAYLWIARVRISRPSSLVYTNPKLCLACHPPHPSPPFHLTKSGSANEPG